MSTRSWRGIAAALAVALVASLVGLGVALTRGGDDGGSPTSSSAADEALDLREAESAALDAARAAAVQLTSYDHATLEEDFAWVEDSGTQELQDQFSQISTPIRKAVTELEVHAEGTVQDAAARAEDVDHVTVLLFVDQTLTSAASSERRLVTPRVTLSMVRQDGRWLVDAVELNDQPSS